VSMCGIWTRFFPPPNGGTDRGGEERGGTVTREQIIAVYAKNLRFYAGLFREKKWETDVLHWSVFESTLKEVAAFLESVSTTGDIAGAGNAAPASTGLSRTGDAPPPVKPWSAYMREYGAEEYAAQGYDTGDAPPPELHDDAEGIDVAPERSHGTIRVTLTPEPKCPRCNGRSVLWIDDAFVPCPKCSPQDRKEGA
jgi:hypothetical protein